MKAAHKEWGDNGLTDYVDRLRFPADPWRLIESTYDAKDIGTSETLFAMGNGYLGFRGNVEEGHVV